jgi:hypothetical protein
VTDQGSAWITSTPPPLQNNLQDPPRLNTTHIVQRCVSERKASAKRCERPCVNSRMISWRTSSCIAETAFEQQSCTTVHFRKALSRILLLRSKCCCGTHIRGP